MASSRLQLDLVGTVQGVGFRPYVFRLASAENLGGFVHNTADGVHIEVEGAAASVSRFLDRLAAELPPHACVEMQRSATLPIQGERHFVVTTSTDAGVGAAVVMADLATCPDCLRDIQDPSNRRYRYPFTTCVHCGPRYSIIEALPYDRARTTMRHFPLCAACQAEYSDPTCRRFHAETIACADCGPQLALWDAAGTVVAQRYPALQAAADALHEGRILALKGLGGFQLLVDATNSDAVDRLRRRKRRPRKPFALMAPSLAAVAQAAQLDAEERRVLLSPEAPIVLLRRRPTDNIALSPPPGMSLAATAFDAAGCESRSPAAEPVNGVQATPGHMPAMPEREELASGVAASSPTLGFMLPYTPLHHLLLQILARPIVATSGNLGDEPIVTDEAEARRKLAGIADAFLVHDRQILRPIDDSIVRVMAGQTVVLRRARGYAPLPIMHRPIAEPILALGGQQKAAIATGQSGRLFLGPHVGDLHTVQTREVFAQAIDALPRLHGIVPASAACDRHPDYHTTQCAAESGLPVQHVPHHLAHVLAAMVDNALHGPVLGVSWDGTGYGGDGTIWGGEFLQVTDGRFRRVGHLLPFRLPGGEAAVREPRRAAIGLLHALRNSAWSAHAALPPVAGFTAAERTVLTRMLSRAVNAPLTSSAGRLFDAVAALLGLCQVSSFEGEAAMAVEFAADQAIDPAPLPDVVLQAGSGPCVLDWRPLMTAVVEARLAGMAAEPLAAGLHQRLAEAIVAMARRIDIPNVVLTGGCFQNAHLTERTVELLRVAGFAAYWHRRIPPNDGGLAAGQLAFAARPLVEERR